MAGRPPGRSRRPSSSIPPVFIFVVPHRPFPVFEPEAGDVHAVFAALEVLVAQVKGEPDTKAVLLGVGDFRAEGVDPALDQHPAEDAGGGDEILLGFSLEAGLGSPLADMVAHGDGLPPDRGDIADQPVELVGVERLADGFGMVDEFLDFSLHGDALSVDW